MNWQETHRQVNREKLNKINHKFFNSFFRTQDFQDFQIFFSDSSNQIVQETCFYFTFKRSTEWNIASLMLLKKSPRKLADFESRSATKRDIAAITLITASSLLSISLLFLSILYFTSFCLHSHCEQFFYDFLQTKVWIHFRTITKRIFYIIIYNQLL